MRWLNDYVKADMPIKEFVADMTMSGSKVETYHKMSDPINNVVVAKVLKLERHPDSEKLWICQLDAGRDEPVQILRLRTCLRVRSFPLVCTTAQ